MTERSILLICTAACSQHMWRSACIPPEVSLSSRKLNKVVITVTSAVLHEECSLPYLPKTPALVCQPIWIALMLCHPTWVLATSGKSITLLETRTKSVKLRSYTSLPKGHRSLTPRAWSPSRSPEQASLAGGQCLPQTGKMGGEPHQGHHPHHLWLPSPVAFPRSHGHSWLAESRAWFRCRGDLHPALCEVDRGSGASISYCCCCKKRH